MTMTQILEENKEKIIRQLDAAATIDQAKPVLEAVIDRTLYRYNEDSGNDRMREAAAGYLRAVKTAVPFITSVGEVRAFERVGTESRAKKTYGGIILFLVFLIAGGALSAALLLTQTKLLMIPTALVLMAAAAVCFFLAGRFSVNKAGKQARREFRFECLLDSGAVYRTLHSVMMVTDQYLDQIEVEEKWDSRKLTENREKLSNEEIALFSGLLEALQSRDAEYAFDRLGDIRFYLHMKGVDVVDYSPEFAPWFDRMPSDTQGTLRPALVSDGKVLKKGLASIRI